MNFGDVMKMKVEDNEVLYAVCTWGVDDGDPNFSRGILLADKGMVKKYLKGAGKYFEIKVEGTPYIAFPWLDAPIFLDRTEGVVGQVSRRQAKAICDSLCGDETEIKDTKFQDAMIRWMNILLMDALFDYLDGINKK